MGQLVGRLRTVEGPQHVVERLERSNALRVWLAHHFFHERSDGFFTAEGRTNAIDELRGVRAYLMETVEMLEATAQPALDRMGLTAERVRKAGEEYIAKLRGG